MLLQGTLATIKHSYEKVILIAGLSKGDNSLFVPVVIIMSSGNSEMKDGLTLGHKFTISVRVVSGQVCVNMAHSVYLAFQQGQAFGQWLPQANWRCRSCLRGEERTWQRVNSWALWRTSSSFTLCAEAPSQLNTGGAKLELFVLGLVLNWNHLLFIPQSMSFSLDPEICLPKQRFWFWLSILPSV